MADFTGFTFNGKKSSDMGITRVSNGSRYNEDLLPAFQDRTAQVAGADRMDFFGSNYTSRAIPIQIAFDTLTDKQYRDLRTWLGDKQIHPLVLEESPYKIYYVKISGTPQLQTICFNESAQGREARIYKGEGTINFIAYDPFGYAPYTVLDSYTDQNKNEWAAASGMLTSTQKVGFDTLSDGIIRLYNPGDVAAPLQLKIPLGDTSIDNLIVSLYNNDELTPIDSLQFNSITKQGSDTAFIINSELNLCEGIDEDGNKTGNLYDRFIAQGNYFHVPLTRETTPTEAPYIQITEGVNAELSYTYLYY